MAELGFRQAVQSPNISANGPGPLLPLLSHGPHLPALLLAPCGDNTSLRGSRKVIFQLSFIQEIRMRLVKKREFFINRERKILIYMLN